MGVNHSMSQLAQSTMTPDGHLLSKNGKFSGLRLLAQDYVNGKSRKLLETADVLLTRSMRHQLENLDKNYTSPSEASSHQLNGYHKKRVDNGSAPPVKEGINGCRKRVIDCLDARRLRSQDSKAGSLSVSPNIEAVKNRKRLLNAKKRVVKKARRQLVSSSKSNNSRQKQALSNANHDEETISPSLSEVQVSTRLWSSDVSQQSASSSSTNGVMESGEPYYVFRMDAERVKPKLPLKSPVKDVLGGLSRFVCQEIAQWLQFFCLYCRAVPQWRIVQPGPPCNPPLDSSTGRPLEPVDEETFMARHQKQEADERRCQKLERQWRREMDLKEKWEEKERKTRERLRIPTVEPTTVEEVPAQPKQLPCTFALDLNNVDSIIVKRDVTVVAFGRPVPTIPSSRDFSLPWKLAKNSTKRNKQSHHV